MKKSIPPTNPALLDEIIAVLRKGTTFCLSGHQSPDADVVGSELAMAMFIESLGPGKKIDICNYGSPPKHLSYLSQYESIKSVDKVDGHYDVVIVFECSGSDRMGGIIDLDKQAKNVINIDHHLHNPNYGSINFVEPHTSSTAEMIFKIIFHAKGEVSKEQAISLYTGIVADTGWFRYGNTNAQTHDIVKHLLAAGVPVAQIAERFYMSRSETALRLLAYVLTNMKLHFDNRVAILTIPDDVYQSLGAHSDDVEEVVNYGLKIESVLISVLLKKKSDPDLIKISLRSKDHVDINRIARTFNGGGHKNASGCVIQGNLDTATEKILKEISQIL